MLNRFRNFLNYETRNISSNQDSTLYRVHHSLILYLIVFVVIRLVACIELLDSPEQSLHLLVEYDPLAVYAKSHAHQLNVYFLLSLICFCVFIYEINVRMYFSRPDHIVWQDLIDLAVRLIEAYNTARKPNEEICKICHNLMQQLYNSFRRRLLLRILPNVVLYAVAKVVVRVVVWTKFHHVELRSFQKTKLVLFEHMGLTNRIKLTQMMLLIEKFNYCCIVGIRMYCNLN